MSAMEARTWGAIAKMERRNAMESVGGSMTAVIMEPDATG